eukprot:TRINITY_DN31089_c0_g1_i1.p1 TRINITY_DN31089_c0_g1~~TRINITY_DN31089_c0_g1_i1.p1  ORF type:complete len:435 (+),score=-30.91 TRINITY_DN31089_c0_g1_i1:109-1413(+)
MDFSEVYSHDNTKLCKWSPNGKYLASMMKHRLLVRDAETLQVVQLFTCLDSIQELSWSCDSLFILCGLYKKGVAQIWSLTEPGWTCKIDEGIAGLSHARWGPSGRHILTVSDFQVRLTVWSLLDRATFYIKNPKFSSQGLSFSPDGKMMALAERKDCKDFVSLFSCDSWELLRQFKTDTLDLADLVWSRDGRSICVWDTNLQYKLLIYSPDGRLLTSHVAYENALGIKSVAWSPSSAFLAIGSYDQKVRIFDGLVYKQLTDFGHLAVSVSDAVAVYREVPSEEFRSQTRYVLEEGVVRLPSIKLKTDVPNPPLGVGWVRWSSDSKYLLTRNDNMPNVLWIWSLTQLALNSIIIQKEPVISAGWDETSPQLTFCTGTGMLYLWTPTGCSCVAIPETNFALQSVLWNPAGNSLVLMDKDKYCLAFTGSTEEPASDQ